MIFHELHDVGKIPVFNPTSSTLLLIDLATEWIYLGICGKYKRDSRSSGKRLTPLPLLRLVTSV